MSNDFQKTVNLKDKAEKERQRMLYGEEEKVKSKASEIDEVYKAKEDDNLRKISKPVIRNVNSTLYKKIILILGLIIFLTIGYFLFFSGKKEEVKTSNQTNSWYAVKLSNGEIYYGQIENTGTDPVVIKNVYYDYDMMNKEGKEENTAGNLRLVKKGKETYGPEGTMQVVRQNVVYMDVLKSDSKVLQAILDYESKVNKNQ